MKGLIVQKANIFIARSLPEYVSVAYTPVGIDDDAFRSHLATMGNALYPHTIEHLRQLNVSDISSLKDAHGNFGGHDIVQMPEGIVDLDGLKRNLGNIAAAWVQFDARIHPSVAIGTDYVRIQMAYSTEDSWEGPEASRDRKAIEIAAKFNDPQAARIGLRPLDTIYPEMSFEEMLHLGRVPEEVGRLQDSLQDSRNLSSRVARYLSSQLQEIGIVPYSARHYDAATGERTDSPVTSFDEVADIDDKNGWGPTIYARFGGRGEVELQFLQLALNSTFPEDSGYYLTVKNKSARGTLEDILERAQSL